MTNFELKQLRRLLFLDVSDAAKLVGRCEPRTWQRWEKGDRAIPCHVDQAMKMLALSRLEMLKVEFDENDPGYRYFDTFEEYKASNGKGDELKWRLAQSIAAFLLVEREARIWQQQETVE